MAVFTACLVAAGAGLSLLARVQGLVLVLAGLALAIAAAALLSPALGTGHGWAVTLLVAVVALQVGYGAGIILRARLARREQRSTERVAAPPSDAPEAAAQRLPRSHESGPLNHP